MTRPLSLFLVTSLLMAACSSAPTTAPTQSSPDPSLNTLHSDIRPGSKGQRLEFAQLEGEMVIPAGTSAYSIQSASQTALFKPSSTQPAWLELFTPAAQAQETDPNISRQEGDEPLEEAQLKKLTVRVNQQSVSAEILSAVTQTDGSVVVSFRLKNVPTTDNNAIIELASPSGRLKIKGVVAKIDQDIKLSERFDVGTTALAETLELSDNKNLTADQLRKLAKDETVQKLRDKIYELFIKPPKDQRFDDVIRPIARGLVQNSAVERYLVELRQCSLRRCNNPPASPPEVERQLLHENPALLTEVNRRVRLRVRLQAQTSSTNRQVTQAELDRLMSLGPVLRRAACRELKVSPCPGLTL